MHILLIGVNHRAAPIEVRERLAFRRDQLPAALADLRSRIGLDEAAILSTCNRVEIYARVDELDGTIDRIQRFLSEHGQVALPGLVERLYNYAEPRSVHHLFSVASGLDSMVLGEAEIACQVKHAYEWAKASGATGKVLNALFQRALNAAKAIRTQTAIGRGAMSIGTVAVELAEKIFGGLSRASILLIGAGKIGEVALRRLTKHGVQEVVVMNRSLDRAVQLAAAHGASAFPLEQLERHLLAADIVISSTSAPSYLLTHAGVAAAMPSRHQRPLCIVDLGVPRNVEPSVAGIENVYLFDVDDLQGLVAQHQRVRERALGQSQAIIDQKVESFLSWWRSECRVANVEWRVRAGQLSSSLVTRHSSLR